LSRLLGIGLAVVLAIGVVAAIVISFTQNHHTSPSNLTVVHGVIGSEKLPFFQDPDVIREFNAHGYDVRVDTAGSRQIATTVDLSKYDFAFPAGQPAGIKIQQDRHAKTTYVPFFTPMAIATFTTIGDLLVTTKAATKTNGVYTLDMGAFLALVNSKERWNQIPGSKTHLRRRHPDPHHIDGPDQLELGRDVPGDRLLRGQQQRRGREPEPGQDDPAGGGPIDPSPGLHRVLVGGAI
jgi:hypothetical protein